MKFLQLALFLSFYIQVNGQVNDKIWAMGYGCCSPNFSGMNLDFSSGFLNITSVVRHINFTRTTGQIFDSNNNLIISSNGVYIANALDDTMQNGAGLNPSNYTTTYFNDGLAIPQANIILPVPNSNTEYYLFHLTINDYGNTNASYFLYYSYIDMTLNNGLGAVTQKNVILLNDSIIPGELAACKHANGRDWWLLAHEFITGRFYKFLVTPTGILGPYIQDLIHIRGLGQCVFSEQGDKFAMYEEWTDLDVWDFDRCTGDLSNNFHSIIDDTSYASGVSFSPSGRYLYVSSMNYLYQYDLQASNIDSSRITVGVYDGFVSTTTTHFGRSKLASDGKIYIVPPSGSQFIHVINYPDSSGVACALCQHCIQLPAFNGSTIPNHPNYSLGPIVGSQCDSLVSVKDDLQNTSAIKLFPNPVEDILYVSSNIRESKMRILDILGKEQDVNINLLDGNLISIDVHGLKSGVYTVTIQYEKGIVRKEFIKM